MWRPKDWENPFDAEVKSIEEECKKRGIDSSWYGEAGVGQEAYEAGATAMLEALKKEAIHIKGTKGWEWLKDSYEEWLHGDKVGYIVFIPEEVRDET